MPKPIAKGPAPKNDRKVALVAAGGGLLAVGVAAALWLGGSRQPSETPAAASTAPPGAVAAPAVPDRDAASFQPVTQLDHLRAAAAAFTQGDLQRSQALYEEAVRSQPDDAEALNGLGLV